MNIFLKLKHWQIFLIWIGASIQMQMFMKTDFWFISFGIYVGLIFGWIYSIGKVLNKDNSELTKKLNIWSIIYLIAMIPFAINFHSMMNQSYERISPLILVACGIIGIVAMINVVLISSKTLKETDTSEKLTFAKYALEFFLILYMVIGVWILQPKLNKLLNRTESTTGNNT